MTTSPPKKPAAAATPPPGSPPTRSQPPPKEPEDEDGTRPIFIYGGPWITQRKPDLFLDIRTPVNVQLSGMFKKSFAYRSLKERTPKMLTGVIDLAARMQAAGLAAFLSELKHDLVTNKPYAPFKAQGEEYDKWNEWLKDQKPNNYFGNNWCFTECYVYRKIIEGCALNNLANLDPFESQKKAAINGSIEPMCVVAEKMLEYIEPKEEKSEKKEPWVALMKVALWANRCDMSHTVGESANMTDVCPQPILPLPKPTAKPKPPKKGKPIPVAPPLTDMGYFDPFQVSLDLKPNLLIDESAKSFDLLFGRCAKMKTAIEKNEAKDPSKPEPDWLEMFPSSKKKKGKKEKKPPPSAETEEPAEPPEPPKNIPCPAKMTVPSYVFFDIVCDNTGYELFADICIAHYAVAQQLTDKVRFHVKKYPWFVSDVTINDFKNLINACKSASYSKTATVPPQKSTVKTAEGDAPPEEPQATTRNIGSSALNQLAEQWQKFLDDETFMVMAEDYWTYPHTFTDMKRLDYDLYRKLQYSAMIMYKGDLNYRKLMGERRAFPASKMDPNLQGYMPAPCVVVRTIKSETVCGLPKGRQEQIDTIDPDWMEKGNFGVIQISKKADKFPKKPDRPCVDYGKTCYGEGVCPEHKDF